MNPIWETVLPLGYCCRRGIVILTVRICQTVGPSLGSYVRYLEIVCKITYKVLAHNISLAHFSVLIEYE